MPDAPPIPIVTIRGQRVILDADLAVLYGVPTKRLNESVRRNQERFPDEFCFSLKANELRSLKSQIATSNDPEARSVITSQKRSGRGGRRKLPNAFTEHGALQAANILRSPEAIKMSLFIIRAFLKMREALAANAAILRRLAEIDRTLLLHDRTLRDVYQKLLPLLDPPPEKPGRRIGFHQD